ncbi:hypothetical protein [Sphingobacterium paludis]|jgi:hypothetical protein|uniref:DUF4468 domain-containing protein n=1 Tax=Sphingobacterium paludis TaxID=1476465 RepID=A0A4R7D173_9SPHI|nr:hypothetical protein [Sphingobacterium paludis]TDS13264.1 hypothetical protein B0I21_105400 [Sphingobacterium paludis]
MKKSGLVITLLLLAQLCFAQYFTLTPKGFLAENQADYVVLDFPNVKQAELYKRVQRALVSMYKDPKEVLSFIEGESITVNGYQPDAISNKRRANAIAIAKATYEYDLSYSLSILFKDEKIRFNRPTFECRRWYEGGYKSNWATGWSYLPLVKEKNNTAAIFDNKGQILAHDVLEQLNHYLNSLIKEILDKSQNTNDW